MDISDEMKETVARELLVLDDFVFNKRANKGHHIYPAITALATMCVGVLSEVFLKAISEAALVDLETNGLIADEVALVGLKYEVDSEVVTQFLAAVLESVAEHYRKIGPLTSYRCTKDHGND